MTTYQNLKNEGKIEEKELSVINAFKKGYTIQQIVDFLDLPLENARIIIEKYSKSQRQN